MNNSRNTKDGRYTNGRRLGWISEAMYQRVAGYAERYGYKTVNDAVIVLLDMGLTEDETATDWEPPAPNLFEVTNE